LTSQLVEAGFNVFATGRDSELLESLKSETGCQGAVADLAIPAACIELFRKAESVLGQVDVLVNNAGMNVRKAPVTDTSLEEWETQYAVNLRAPFLLSREALRGMSSRQSGHIVNVVSTVARTSAANYSVYSTMKYGLMGFTNCLIKEAREANVKVTAVYPGGTDTDFRAEDRPEYMRPESAAAMITNCILAPDDVVVHELVYRPMIETNF
jgi:NAD(P)-dependent dehydrogenase (short-subunit alcohol dehydrogenase family)